MKTLLVCILSVLVLASTFTGCRQQFDEYEDARNNLISTLQDYLSESEA